MPTVYISIGNSDDKLSQTDWSSYVLDVDRAFEAAVRYEGARVHGRWYSLPTEPWQNACWCAEWHEDLALVVEALRRKLQRVAADYQQESIAWAVAETEFIRPGEARDRS
jgi:hypothetical protein